MSQNESIRSAIKGADGVIYQSEWSRVLATKMLSIKPKRSIVIPNGVDMKLVNSAVPVDRQGWDFIFTVSAHWRVNKRFEAVLAAYRSLVSKFPDRKIGMFVLGESPVKVGKNERIRLFGRVGLSEVFSTLKSSNALVHICHLDACPNSVVEALSCRVPVVCNNIGGTPELVKGDGVIVDLDKEYDFRPIKSMKQVGSGSVDVEKLSEGMAKMLLWKNAVERPDLDIRNVARRYCEYFEQILEGRKS
jgi:glycosyltransferase involved in cell wall biosynthesis